MPRKTEDAIIKESTWIYSGAIICAWVAMTVTRNVFSKTTIVLVEAIMIRMD